MCQGLGPKQHDEISEIDRKCSSYMRVSTNAGIQFYQETSISTDLTINGNLLANQISTSGGCSINGNLDVGSGVVSTTKISLTSNVPTNYTLAVTSKDGNLFQGEYIANTAEVGCLSKYQTSASSTSWRAGILGANTNEFNI